MQPLGWGLFSLALLSVLFEPLRMSLWRLGDEVGGVGGVGGLTNQFSPSSPFCNISTSGDASQAQYCFRPGWLGFTPFGGTVLLLTTLPLFVAALAAHRIASARKDDVGVESGDVAVTGGPHRTVVAAFSILGGSASTLWFLAPLAYYANAPFYQKDVWHMALAISIAAAYPLGWHLSFVAIPSSAAPFLAPLLGLTPATLKTCHVRAAWSTVFWAGVHATGELAYMASQGQLSLIWIHPKKGSDNLTFVFGLCVFLILLALTTHAFSRKLASVAPSFRTLHRAFATVLLLVASAHWWPFAIFLAPAVACAATGFAVGRSGQPDAGKRNAPLALAAAIVSTLGGICSVWAARQAWMLAHPSQYYTLPVHIFPPMALGLAFVLARGTAVAVLAATADRTVAATPSATSTARESREAPLLNPAVL